MTSVITSILTDTSLRDDQAVAVLLMDDARLGQVWIPKSLDGI